MDEQTPDLFTPITIGGLTLRSRIAMAPLTRNRAGDDGVPTPMMVTYYRQRATAGLIITEGTQPSAGGQGYLNTPGLHNQAQVEGWRAITSAVREQGCKIFVQLMHCGRITDPELIGNQPVGPSAVSPRGGLFTSMPRPKTVPLTTRDDGGISRPYQIPKALEIGEIKRITEEFRHATELAVAAGFDGVELHAGSGYLPHQFLSSNSNLRTDRYGGSPVNRCRFVVELLEAMAQVRGADRVALKVSPGFTFNDMHDANPRETYLCLLEEIRHLNLAWIQTGTFHGADFDVLQLFRDSYGGTLLGTAGFDRERANNAIVKGLVDMVAFGKSYIANPDLPQRFLANAGLNRWDADSFYGGTDKGYIDYPTLEQQGVA